MEKSIGNDALKSVECVFTSAEKPPETTIPETTVPETTVPETTIPEPTVPETTVSDDTTTAPEEVVPARPPALEGNETDLYIWIAACIAVIAAAGIAGAIILGRKTKK